VRPEVKAGTPAWVPANMPYSEIPERFRAMIAEIIEPAYEQLVVRARDALEKTTGLTIVHLAWQEIVDQIDLARDYEKTGCVLGIVTANREPLVERHLRLVYTKFAAANFLMRVREFRRGLIRAMRDTPHEPAAAQATAGPAHGTLGSPSPERAPGTASPQQDGPPGDSPTLHEPTSVGGEQCRDFRKNENLLPNSGAGAPVRS
jgi:hypothetical protein